MLHRDVERQYNITLRDTSSPMELSKYDQRHYDHLLILSPKMKGKPHYRLMLTQAKQI